MFNDLDISQTQRSIQLDRRRSASLRALQSHVSSGKLRLCKFSLRSNEINFWKNIFKRWSWKNWSQRRVIRMVCDPRLDKVGDASERYIGRHSSRALSSWWCSNWLRKRGSSGLRLRNGATIFQVSRETTESLFETVSNICFHFL